jgi:hypothetical protein
MMRFFVELFLRRLEVGGPQGNKFHFIYFVLFLGAGRWPFLFGEM